MLITFWAPRPKPPLLAIDAQRCSISAAGSTQATNRESIQKIINRLDEDLSTLGQISKLSETLSFPRQVVQSERTAAPHSR